MKSSWGRNVISETGGGGKLGGFFHRLRTTIQIRMVENGVAEKNYLPNPQEFDKEIIREAGEKHLANDVDV